MTYPNQQVTSLRKSGNLDEAMRIGKEALAHAPDDFRLKGTLAWVHYDYIKRFSQEVAQRSKKNQPFEQYAAGIRQHLMDYSRLLLPRPDLCFSLIAIQIASIGPKLDEYVPFLAWAGVQSFRSEDYHPYQTEKGASPSLVTKVARAAMSWAQSWPDRLPEVSEFILQLAEHALANHLETSDNLVWISYSRSAFYLQLGRIDDAAAEMRHVLKKNRRDYWAWQQMARIEQQRDPSLAIACYAQAMNCTVPPKFTCKLHLRFGQLLQEQGEEAAAIAEYLAAARIYQSEGWKFPEALEAVLQAPWFNPESANQDQPGFYRSHAQTAGRVLYSEIETVEATFLESRTLKNGRTMELVSLQTGIPPTQQLIRWSEAGGEALVPGAPLSATVARDDTKFEVLNVATRPAGIPWDCLQERHGIVDSLSKDGSRGGVYLAKDTHAILMSQTSVEEQPVKVGDIVKVWVCENPTKENRLEAFRTSLSGNLSLVSNVTTKEGKLHVHEKGFAFIDDIFVPPPVVDRTLDGCDVSALCVWELNKSKRAYGWKAVKVTPISHQEQGPNS